MHGVQHGQYANLDLAVQVFLGVVGNPLSGQTAGICVVPCNVGHQIGVGGAVVKGEYRDASLAGLLQGGDDAVGVDGVDADHVIALSDEVLDLLLLGFGVDVAIGDGDFPAALGALSGELVVNGLAPLIIQGDVGYGDLEGFLCNGGYCEAGQHCNDEEQRNERLFHGFSS